MPPTPHSAYATERWKYDNAGLSIKNAPITSRMESMPQRFMEKPLERLIAQLAAMSNPMELRIQSKALIIGVPYSVMQPNKSCHYAGDTDNL